jgi:glycosyl transferase family 2
LENLRCGVHSMGKSKNGVIRRILRKAWHGVNPYWLSTLTRAARARAHLLSLPTKAFRTTWPSQSEAGRQLRSVAIVSVNYNTAAHIAHLVFSLYRILGRNQFCRLVIVDNASTDHSPELLAGLRDAGLAEVIFNSRQRYHGPALNQAMDYLAASTRAAESQQDVVDAVWILDSDSLVLRPDAVSAPLEVLRSSAAGIVGELQYLELPSGYAHPSSILLNPERVWQRRVHVFEEDGSPARQLHLSLKRFGIGIQDFPYRSANYVLHLGRATLGAILERGDQTNRYFEWAAQNGEHDYHGNPDGHLIHERFLSLFNAEVRDESVQALVYACNREMLLQMHVPSGRNHSPSSRRIGPTLRRARSDDHGDAC